MTASGHRYFDLPHYTARQLVLFYQKALARERKARADRTVDVAYGTNGGKELDGYLKQLTAR